MDRIASALGEAARWRIVQLLAERPRSVGELAELTGLRQPQTTKHLQALARVGLATVIPLGQRRVYSLEAAPLAEFADRLGELVEHAEAHEGERDVIARYSAAIEADAAVADRDRWADERTFSFERTMDAPQEIVWQHWTDSDLLAAWWFPPPMVVVECALEPRAGGRAVLEYRDADGRYRSVGVVRAAEEPERLTFDLSVLDADGAATFTCHYDLALAAVPGGTQLRLGARITASTVEAVPYIAGMETGWVQVLDNLADAVAAYEHTTTPIDEKE